AGRVRRPVVGVLVEEALVHQVDGAVEAIRDVPVPDILVIDRHREEGVAALIGGFGRRDDAVPWQYERVCTYITPAFTEVAYRGIAKAIGFVFDVIDRRLVGGGEHDIATIFDGRLVQYAQMRTVHCGFDALYPVAGHFLPEGDDMIAGQRHELEILELGGAVAFAQPHPDHAGGFAHREMAQGHAFAEFGLVARLGGRGHGDAVHAELPAVKDTGEGVVFVVCQGQRGAAVRT